MLKYILFILGCIANSAFATTSFVDKELQLFATKYELDYKVDIKKQTLSATGIITVKNNSANVADHIPMRLYRLLHVSTVKNNAGAPLAFSQHVLSNEDWPVLQTNYVEVQLKKGIEPNESYTFQVQFDGSLLGYSETGMNYVKDSISADFSILRMDAFAYPIITYPNDDVNHKAKFWLHTYDYDVRVTVPTGYVVANGGSLQPVLQNTEQTTYRYVNKLPAWRMDFAIARYEQYSKGRYSVFSWESPEDSNALLQEINNTFELYSNWFGPLQQELGYTFIEVPENYGAQADVTAVIQDAEGFKELGRVYHEISHQWNVKTLDTFSPRWNEGLATYLQAATTDLGKPGHLESKTQTFMNQLRDRFKDNPIYSKTAFIDYGKADLNSYAVGMVFFRIMSDLLGTDEFNAIIGKFYLTYHKQGATTQEFIDFVNKNSKVDLTTFFNEWAYSGKYTERVLSTTSYRDLIDYYSTSLSKQMASIPKNVR
ncbi:M1 family aminopeptidase [Pseudoalteromonas xiamenensis]